MRLHLVRVHVHKSIRALIRGGVRYEVYGRQSGLPPGRHKHQRGFLRGMRADRRVRRLVHRRHPGAVELARVPLDVTLERHRSHRGFEVEEAALRSLLLLYAEPVREVVRVGQRRGQPDDSHRALSARGYEPHAAHDHLEDRTAVGAEKVDLVDDHQRNLRDVRPSLPITRDAVPLLGRAHDDVRALKRAHVRRVVARQLHQLLVQHHAQFILPILDAFADERLERRDVNHLPAGEPHARPRGILQAVRGQV